ncbi:MAG TPA: PEGA domain-containing protein [Kofleriaceae bacterium]|nr:PEGA domain-containing protein [Kofleriaceae bacterium]
MNVRVARLAMVAVLLAAAPELARAEQPTPQQLAEAEARYERGVKLFRAGDHKGALAEFEASYAVSGAYEVLFNIAVTQKKLFRWGDAVRTFERYLRDGGAGIAAAERAAVEKELAEIRKTVAEVTVVVAGATARIEVDGRVEGDTPLAGPILLGSGEHTIRATRDGEVPDEKTVKVVSGQIVEVVLAPVPPVVAPTSAFISIVSRPVGATLSLDGKELGAAPWSGSIVAGGYRLRAHLDGHIDHAQELVVTAGQDRAVEINLVAIPPPPPPRPIYKQWWFWTGAAVTAAAVSGAIFYASQPPGYDNVIHYGPR